MKVSHPCDLIVKAGIVLLGIANSIYLGYCVYMANTASAKKEIRASARKRVFNLCHLRTVRSLMKGVVAKHRSGDAEGARAQFREAQKAIDKAAKRGVIKQQTASRRKAMLARTIKPAAE